MFDVLLPAKSDAYPILLPQPPAYTPALFPSAELALRLAAPSTFVTSCEPTNHGNFTKDEASETSEQELQSLVALSSCNYPLINLLTAPSEGKLLGRHNISDAVKERLPLLIESGETRSTPGEVNSSQKGQDGNSVPTSPARDTTTLRGPNSHISDGNSVDNNSLKLPGLDSLGRAASFDWWKWVSVFAVFFMTGTLARIGILRLRRWKAQQLREEKFTTTAITAVPESKLTTDDRPTVVPALGEKIGVTGSSVLLNGAEDPKNNSPDALGGNALQVTPITPGTSESLGSIKLPAVSPGQESEDLPQRAFKKRRRKRGKGKGKGKSGYEDGESDEEHDIDHKKRSTSSPEHSPKSVKNGLQLEVDARSPVTQPLGAAIATENNIFKRKDAIARMDGLAVSDDVLGKLQQSRVDDILFDVCFLRS